MSKDNESLIRPTDMHEANSICVDLTKRGIDFILHYNAGGITIRILSQMTPA